MDSFDPCRQQRIRKIWVFVGGAWHIRQSRGIAGKGILSGKLPFQDQIFQGMVKLWYDRCRAFPMPEESTHCHIVFLFMGYIAGGVKNMNTKQAVANGILELCRERDIAINALASGAGVPPSTVYSMLNEKSKNPGWYPLRNSAMRWKLPCVTSLTTRNFRDWSRKSSE